MSAVAQAVPAATWQFDPVHSHVDFEVTHNVSSTFRGTFREIDAKLDTTGDTPRVEGVAKVASVDVKDENLAGHLQSPDFFDAERAPEIRFVAEDVTFDEDGRAFVRGEITIRGVTKPLEATGSVAHLDTDITGGERVILSLDATVDRTEFGIDWNAPLGGDRWILGNDVRIVANVQFTKGA